MFCLRQDTHTIEGNLVSDCKYKEYNELLFIKRTLHKHLFTIFIMSSRKFLCQGYGCNAQLSNASNLNRHIKTHTREKTFKCHFEGCVSEFGSICNLKMHLRTHTGEKPFKCHFEGCVSEFGSIVI